MQRRALPPRPDWRTRVEALGFDYHSIDGEPYWAEEVGYHFEAGEIDTLETATQALHQLCMELVKRTVERGDYARLGIADAHATLLERSYGRGERPLYGRMDLVYDGHGAPQLLEYNADTPTALFEAAVVQWQWLQDRSQQLGDHCDQFNSIHEKLLAEWRRRRAEVLLPPTIHFACVQDAAEDYATSEYLRDTCVQAGFHTEPLDIGDIGWRRGQFVDVQDRPIQQLCKLYPWEWLLAEPFGPHIAGAGTIWIEPAWKLMLSNKAMLVLLWEMFPGHPNLLPAARLRIQLPGAVAAKPWFGREGEGVSLLAAGESLPGAGNEGWIYQQQRRLPQFDGRYPVIGSWVIGDTAAGIGIREDAGPITTNASHFVPHWFSDGD